MTAYSLITYHMHGEIVAQGNWEQPSKIGLV